MEKPHRPHPDPAPVVGPAHPQQQPEPLDRVSERQKVAKSGTRRKAKA